MFTPPGVTIVIRSMGRPELRRALVSVASQDHPAIEVVVIDATGGRHPPLPELDLPAGMAVRLVPGDRPLSRPQAANRGLDEVRGVWFGFLDDDDEFEPDHVSRLIAAGSGTDHLLVYGATRFLDAQGRQTSLLARPFSPALLPHGLVLTFPAALMRVRALSLGCRFDERLLVCEDRDFFMQVARHSAFTFVDAPTVRYHTEAGTSGVGEGANRNPLRALRYAEHVLAKWHAESWYPYLAAQRQCFRALRRVSGGDLAGAKGLLLEALERYPDDPNVLASIGHVCARQGDLAEAESWCRRAVSIRPSSGENRLILAQVLVLRGNVMAAAEHAWRAVDDPSHAEAARAALAALGNPPDPGNARRAERQALEDARVAKADPAAVDDAIAQAERLAATGEWTDALGWVERAWDAGATWQRVMDSARPLLASAFAAERNRSIARFLGERIPEWTPEDGDASGPLQVLSRFGTKDSVADWALQLAQSIGRGRAVALWSVDEPHPSYRNLGAIEQVRVSVGAYPRGGHLLIVGHDYPLGDWLEDAQPARATLCVSSQDVTPLIARFVELEGLVGRCPVILAYRSAAIRDGSGMRGDVLVTP